MNSTRSPNHDIVGVYMREVAQYKLITPAEELSLATRIENGDMVARDKMICANLRLVIMIARRYENYGLPLLDLINE